MPFLGAFCGPVVCAAGGRARQASLCARLLSQHRPGRMSAGLSRAFCRGRDREAQTYWVWFMVCVSEHLREQSLSAC